MEEVKEGILSFLRNEVGFCDFAKRRVVNRVFGFVKE